ncbi:MAG: methyltransferase domain-containing protein [Bryobacteraceae bacterium]|nr:methyltransferase domain-containing protein [Bryobacteraceae bacterium]
MSLVGRVVLSAAAAVVAAGIAWRYASRRRLLPCPAWMAPAGPGEQPGWLAASTLQRLGLRPGMRVLEVGAGWGRLAIPAARRILPGGELTALDVQPRMIERLKEGAARAGSSNLTAVIGEASESHFPPESFDLVYLCTVLGEIPHREAAMRQFHSVLRRGGKLSITEIFPDPHYQPRATVRRLASAAGFQPEETHGSWYCFTSTFVKR